MNEKTIDSRIKVDYGYFYVFLNLERFKNLGVRVRFDCYWLSQIGIV